MSEGSDRVSRVFAERGVAGDGASVAPKQARGPMTVKEYLYARLSIESTRAEGLASDILYFTALSVIHDDDGVVGKLTMERYEPHCSYISRRLCGPAEEVTAELFVEEAVTKAKRGEWIDKGTADHAEQVFRFLVEMKTRTKKGSVECTK